jgi:ABC-type sugar transport system substrate-binding protein
VKAVQNGSIQFAVDQQPYLQGYQAVGGLWLNKNKGEGLNPQVGTTARRHGRCSG